MILCQSLTLWSKVSGTSKEKINEFILFFARFKLPLHSDYEEVFLCYHSFDDPVGMRAVLRGDETLVKTTASGSNA